MITIAGILVVPLIVPGNCIYGCVFLQVSPGEVVTEFRSQFEQQRDPKKAINSIVAKQFNFEVR